MPHGGLVGITRTTLYRLYGLTLESELDLPEVLAASETAVPDISVRLGMVDPEGLPDGRPLGPFLRVAPGALWFSVPDVACFLVTDGTEIVVDPYPGADDDSVRVFLLGSALGALLSQRRMVVLHGNAIRVGDACLVCVGPSGSGKSTLAAEFMRRGYRILADDVVPVDDEGLALPGFPRLKLCQDAAERLDISTDELHPIHPGVLKFNYPLSDAEFCTDPVPVRWVYVLASHDQTNLEVETIRGMDRLSPLLVNTYRVGFLEGMGLRPGHLRACGRLASRAKVSILARPEGVGPKEVADLLLTDLEAHI